MLEGHVIPAGSHIIGNTYAIHMDPAVWEEPEAFRPERFLSADGTAVVRPKAFLPFGTGKRMCLGNNLAETELQLFFTSLLHVFDVQTAAEGVPSLEGTLGATLTPDPFSVRLVPRNVEALVAAHEKSQAFSCLHMSHVKQAGKPSSSSPCKLQGS